MEMRKISFWWVCGIVALSFLTPAMVSAAEPPAPEVSQAEAVLQDLTPQADVVSPDAAICTGQQEGPQEESITLEELNQLVGARKVCGVYCNTWPRVNCSQVCGDAASCFHGYCIYL
jgi:hypothetical protein